MVDRVFLVRWEKTPPEVLQPRLTTEGKYQVYDRRAGQNATSPVELGTLADVWSKICAGFAVRMDNGSTFDPKNHKFYSSGS